MKWFKNMFYSKKMVEDEMHTLGFAIEGVIKALVYKKAGNHKTAKYVYYNALEVFDSLKEREVFIPIRDKITQLTGELERVVNEEGCGE